MALSRMNSKRWSLLIFTACLFALGLWFWSSNSGKNSTQPAPQTDLISATTPEALLAHIRSLQTPLVLVNFWATWCTPCEAEMPHLLEVAKAWESKGMRLVLVSIDEPSDLKEADAFLKKFGVTTPSFYKGRESIAFVKQVYPDWTGSIPTNLIFDSQGQLLEGWEGETERQEFEERLARHQEAKK